MATFRFKTLNTFIACGIFGLSSIHIEAVNLLDVYNDALTGDPVLAAELAGKNADLETERQSLAALLPNLTAGGSTSEKQRALDSQRETYNSHAYQISLRQPLFNAANWFTYQAAKSLSSQAETEYKLAEQDLIFRVADAYFGVLREQENLTSIKAEEAAVLRQLEQTKERFNVGLTAITDVHEAQAVFDNTKVRRIQKQADLDISYEELEQITGVSYQTLSVLDPAFESTPPAPNTAKEWAELAKTNNLTVIATNFAVNSAKDNLTSQRSGHLPTLDFVTEYSHSIDHGASSLVLGEETDQRTVSLELSVPLYLGGATSSLTRQAMFQLEEAQHSLHSAEREAISQARSAFRIVNTDVQRILAEKQSTRSSEVALEASEIGYEVGTRNIVDVLDAQRSLYSAQRDYANARFDFILDTLRLKQSSGILSPEDVSNLNRWLIVAAKQ